MLNRSEKIKRAVETYKANPNKHSQKRGKPLPRNLPCIHLGEETGETRKCGPCGGNVTSKVRTCRAYGSCTVFNKQPDLACCDGCASYVPLIPPQPGAFATPPINPSDTTGYGPIGKRHLLYHVFPVSGNGVWQKAISNLRTHWHLFTGKKFISVAQGGMAYERIDPVEMVPNGNRLLPVDDVQSVRDALPSDAIVTTVQNDPNLWEGASWYRLWDSLASESKPNDIVLYAHAKGVTRKLTSPCHPWTDLLYTLALNYIPRIEEVLRSKPVCGSLPKWGNFFGGLLSNSRWHYSGNMWWGRCGPLLEAIKRTPLPLNEWAAEAWIGAAFHPADAGILFQSPHITHLYHPHELDRVVADYARWSLTNASHYTNDKQ